MVATATEPACSTLYKLLAAVIPAVVTRALSVYRVRGRLDSTPGQAFRIISAGSGRRPGGPLSGRSARPGPPDCPQTANRTQPIPFPRRACSPPLNGHDLTDAAQYISGTGKPILRRPASRCQVSHWIERGDSLSRSWSPDEVLLPRASIEPDEPLSWHPALRGNIGAAGKTAPFALGW
jgi:hypothetical protein